MQKLIDLIFQTLCISLISIASVRADNTCNIWQESEKGILQYSDCSLSDYVFESDMIKPQIRRPNLKTKQVEYNFSPTTETVDVNIRFVNNGPVDIVQPFDIYVYVNFLSEPGNSIGKTKTILSSNGLAAGQEQIMYAASKTFTPPFYVVTVFWLDPWNEELPMGEIWEFNELDNYWIELCGVYPEGYQLVGDEPLPCQKNS